MSVQSVNGQNYGYNAQMSASEKKMFEDAILQMPDNVVYKLANEQAKKQVKDRAKKFMFGLGFVAIPFVYGLNGAINARGKNLTEIFSAESGSLVSKFINATCADLKGAASKMAAGAGVTAKVGGAIAIGLASIGLVRGIFNLNDKTKDFSDKHPGALFLTELAAIFAGTAFIPKALGGLFSKVSSEKIAKMTSKMVKWGEKFNGKKMVKSMQNLWQNMLTKSPSWIKKAGKVGIAIAPPLFIVGLIIETVRHSMKYSKAFNENVNVIRNEQERILEERKKAENSQAV